MIRIVKMGSGYFGLAIKSVKEDLENIEEFVSNGESVILVDSLDDLSKLDIEAADVKMVE